nr:14333_t:CDS:2 [Entrophospora candida]
MERVNLKTIPTIVQNMKEEDIDEDYSEFIPLNKPKNYNVEKLIKMSAMACACTFGVGSHFAIHIIGPLKGILMEQLDLTNTQFSLLIASLTLCNTIIPIVSGLLVARFGTTKSSLVTTTIILIGMIIVTGASWTGKVGLMIIGFMVFGTGIAPLMIVQETIIVQFFQGNGLGFALALGLTFGRLASFFATILAVPLSLMPQLGYRTPFFVATFTCFISWVMSIIYVFLLSYADNRKNRSKEGEAVNKLIKNKKVHWDDIFQLSDLFWWFLVVGLLFGTSMPPFLHLSSNIIKHRFDTTDMLAAWDASIILLIPVILYPFLGLFMDKYGMRLYILISGSAAILMTFLLFLLPPKLVHSYPPILLFAFAYASVPLTLVTLVPLLTKHVSTGLGLLKSVDNIGATLTQTFAGLLLDEHVKRKKYEISNGIEYGHEDDDLVALRMFAILSFLLLLSSLVFWWADKKYRDEDEITFVKTALSKKKKRTIVYIGIIALLLLICWLTFAIVAFEKAGVHASGDNNSE